MNSKHRQKHLRVLSMCRGLPHIFLFKVHNACNNIELSKYLPSLESLLTLAQISDSLAKEKHRIGGKKVVDSSLLHLGSAA